MKILLNLLAAVALLVWGTHIVRAGILRLYGGNLRRILSQSVANRFSAFISGLGVTGLIQSSSATALITTSFVSQGLIPLAPALVIMLGADVGTSLITLVLSFDLSWLSPLLILCGVFLFLARQGSGIGRLGRVLIGLGVIILALQLIVTATRPLTEAAGVKVIFASLTGDPLLDMLVGAFFTLIFYSSLAVVLLTATLTSASVISLPVAMGLVLGANLGSGILVILSTMSTSREGRRLPLGNFLFKLSGCLLFLPFLDPVQNALSSLELGLHGVVVNFHLLFNVAIAALFFFATAPIARLAERALPAEPSEDTSIKPRHLDASALETPSLAISCAAREALRIGDCIEIMLNGMLTVLKTGDRKLARDIRKLDDTVDELYTAVKLYLTQISREALDEKEGRRWTDIISFTINMEQLGDIIERIVIDIEDKVIDKGRAFSGAGMTEICDMHARLIANLRLGMSVFLDGDLKSAQQLIEQKATFRDLERTYSAEHLNRLSVNAPQSIESSSLHLDLISDLRRINSHICSIAYPILEQAGVLSHTRLKDSGKDGAKNGGADAPQTKAHEAAHGSAKQPWHAHKRQRGNVRF